MNDTEIAAKVLDAIRAIVRSELHRAGVASVLTSEGKNMARVEAGKKRWQGVELLPDMSVGDVRTAIDAITSDVTVHRVKVPNAPPGVWGQWSARRLAGIGKPINVIAWSGAELIKNVQDTVIAVEQARIDRIVEFGDAGTEHVGNPFKGIEL